MRADAPLRYVTQLTNTIIFFLELRVEMSPEETTNQESLNLNVCLFSSRDGSPQEDRATAHRHSGNQQQLSRNGRISPRSMLAQHTGNTTATTKPAEESSVASHSESPKQTDAGDVVAGNGVFWQNSYVRAVFPTHFHCPCPDSNISGNFEHVTPDSWYFFHGAWLKIIPTIKSTQKFTRLLHLRLSSNESSNNFEFFNKLWSLKKWGLWN